jgi:ribonuclease HI
MAPVDFILLHKQYFTMNILLCADGGSRGNPGVAGYGFVIYEFNGQNYEAFLENPLSEPLFKRGEYIGHTTNNQAEWQGLVRGLEKAVEMGCESVTICLDSQLVVKQTLKEYKVKKAELKPWFDQTHALLKQIPVWSIHHIYRHLNSAADAVANEAMDSLRIVE